MKKKIINLIIKTVGFLIVSASFIFIYKSFRSMDLRLIYEKASHAWIINIILFSIVYSFLFQIQGITWNANLEIIAEIKTNIYEILSIYSRANIAKYLPGNILVFVERHLLLRKYGISDVRLILINISEIFYFFVVSFVISLISILFGIVVLPSGIINKININLIVIIIIIPTVIAIVLFTLYNKQIVNELFKLSTAKNFKKASINLLLYFSYFILYGFLNVLIFFIFLKINIDFYSILLIISAFSISWVLGYVTPGAPGGIGVRESILIILLSPYFGYTNTFLVAMLSRIITILGEIFAYYYGSLYRSHCSLYN